MASITEALNKKFISIEKNKVYIEFSEIDLCLYALSPFEDFAAWVKDLDYDKLTTEQKKQIKIVFNRFNIGMRNRTPSQILLLLRLRNIII